MTAIVSVADDGGSSGRLREQLDVVALGDLRKCLVALAEDSSVLARAFEHRFEERASWPATPWATWSWPGWWTPPATWWPGSTQAAALLGAAGRVLPATTEKVVLKAEADRGEVDGPGGGLSGRADPPGLARPGRLEPTAGGRGGPARPPTRW